MLYQNEQEISLAPKVIETLLALVERRGEVLSKDELMKLVWTDSIVEEGNLSQNLYLLRKTLGDGKNGKPLIETFRRRGYRFNGEVRRIEEDGEKGRQSDRETNPVCQLIPRLPVCLSPRLTRSLLWQNGGTKRIKINRKNPTNRPSNSN